MGNDLLYNPNKSGSIIILVGAMGTGKTPWIKKFIKNIKFKNIVCYDPVHEYPENYTLFHEWKYFYQYFLKVHKSIVIIEECSSVISSQKDLDLTELMIKVQHRNNIVIFAFHSISDIPPYILKKSNYIVLFAVGDNPKKIEKDLDRCELFKYMNLKKPVFIDRLGNIK